MTTSETDTAFWGVLFWDTVEPVERELWETTRLSVVETATDNELVQEMARVLLKGRRIRPKLWSRCVHTISIAQGLIGNEVELAIDMEMARQLQFTHDQQSITEQLEPQE